MWSIHRLQRLLSSELKFQATMSCSSSSRWTPRVHTKSMRLQAHLLVVSSLSVFEVGVWQWSFPERVIQKLENRALDWNHQQLSFRPWAFADTRNSLVSPGFRYPVLGSTLKSASDGSSKSAQTYPMQFLVLFCKPIRCSVERPFTGSTMSKLSPCRTKGLNCEIKSKPGEVKRKTLSNKSDPRPVHSPWIFIELRHSLNSISIFSCNGRK